MNEKSKNKAQTIRQIVLVAILFIVLAAFLYDKYVLIPGAQEKINEITNKVSLKLSNENRQQIHDIIGFKPTDTFEHNGYEIEQYRFPRGLPGFHRPILDIGFKGDTMAFFRQEPIDNAFIELQGGIAEIDHSRMEDPGTPAFMGAGGGRPPNNNNSDEDEKQDEDSKEDGPDENSADGENN